VITLPSFDH